MAEKYLGLIVRSCGEYWMEEFCSYYLCQGVDEIHILNDGAPEKFYDNLKNHEGVHIKHVKDTFTHGGMKRNDTIQMRHVNALYQEINKRFEWMICCDADEFITTRKNVNRTIREEVKESFAPKGADIIRIPWVIMSCGGRKKSPKSILKEITMRWDHGKPHRITEGRGWTNRKFRCLRKKIPTKCIFRATDSAYMISPHTAKDPHKKYVNSINMKEAKSPFYRNLTEMDIKNGYLLCYHYRTISAEYAVQKLKDSQLYQVRGITADEIMTFDFPEIRDETLKRKITDCGEFFAK